jgi:hypothetical protein
MLMLFFRIAVKSVVGNGESTKLWTDRWLQGKTVLELAPNLFNLISKRERKHRTVAEALINRRWVTDIGEH